jgi:hypothetical protein
MNTAPTGPYEVDQDAYGAAEDIIGDIAAGWPGDPLARYTAMTPQQAYYQDVSERLGAARACLLAQMRYDGATFEKIAADTGLSKPRVQKLVERGRILAAAGEFDLLVRRPENDPRRRAV